MVGVHLKPISTLSRLGRYLRDRISVDTRTLAAFRVAAGVLILADVVARTSRFSYFYTEDGAVPQDIALDAAEGWVFSFFLISTNPYVTAALFALHALIAMQLIIGYKTRLATILCFLFVISLDHRNPIILSYADALFRLLLFWAIFLPLGERWSVDAVHRSREPRTHIASVASAAILFQMLAMYWGNAVQKAAGQLWLRGEATPLVFGLDHVTWALAPYLREFPTLLSIGGWIWFAMLIYVSWLLLLAAGRVRMVIVAAFITVHLAFALTVRIGAFPYVAIAGVALFLQAPFWDDLRRVLMRSSLRYLEPIRVRLIALAERFPRVTSPVTTSSRALTAGYHSFVTIAVLGVLVLPPLAFLQNAELIRQDVSMVERPLTQLARTVAVDQPPWTIFAPTPRTNDRFYVFVALDDGGSLYDLYNDRPLSWERPEGELHRQFQHYRERFFMESIELYDDRDLEAAPHALGEYLCGKWERDRGTMLTQIDMYVVNEQITMETISKPADRDRSTNLIYQHGCSGEPSSEISPPNF